MANHKGEFIRLMEPLADTRRMSDVFNDFLELSTLSILNRVEFSREREDKYMGVIGKYDRKLVDNFPSMLAQTALALGERHQDFLGDIYMEIGMGNARAGQFFTPYHVCRLMAKVGGDINGDAIRERGYITVYDPCCGASGLLIAYAEHFREGGFNPQTQLAAYAEDIDITCCRMSYVQLSLLGIPARVRHMDSLSNEVWAQWVTPFWAIGLFDMRERRRFREARDEDGRGEAPREVADGGADIANVTSDVTLKQMKLDL